MSQVELPQYQCHKKVRAAKITGFRQNGNVDMPDLLLGEIGGTVSLLPDWHEKHKPLVGGYYVVYEDGYTSYSPAEAFEGGYTSVSQTQGVLNTGQPAIKGYRNLSQAEIELMNDIKEAGEQLRNLVHRVQMHIESQPKPEAPHSQVTSPMRWAAIGQTDLQTGLMALTRAVAQPTSF